jgi:hypothetical protein
MEINEFQRTSLVLLCDALWIRALEDLFCNSATSIVPASAWRWSFDTQEEKETFNHCIHTGSVANPTSLSVCIGDGLNSRVVKPVAYPGILFGGGGGVQQIQF